MGWGLGKLQKWGQRCDRAEEVVGKEEEEVQTRESPVKNPPGETERLSP